MKLYFVLIYLSDIVKPNSTELINLSTVKDDNTDKMEEG